MFTGYFARAAALDKANSNFLEPKFQISIEQVYTILFT